MQKVVEFSSIKSKKKYRLISWLNNNKRFNIYLQSYGALSGNYLGEKIINLNLKERPELNQYLTDINLNKIKFEI